MKVAGGALLLVYFDFLSFTSVSILTGLYFIQLVAYRPQNNEGWSHQWFLYHPFWDLVLRYADATFIREEKLDPAGGPFMFCFAPHGVLATCRAATCGPTWPRMYPGKPRWVTKILPPV